MGKLVSKIVLTGGPCAGKTTALAKIEERLSELGYNVFVVSESATELIKGGVKPFGNKAIDLYDFQEIILNYQLSKENTYQNAVKFLPEDSKCVIIYDRGALDNKAYIGQAAFDKLLDKLGISELSIMDNYDMIIHLVTAADGRKENYTLDNNSARIESVDEAIVLDRKTLEAWQEHSNLKIIDNTTNFSEKMDKVIEEINNLIGNPLTIKKQRKYLVEHFDLSLFDKNVSEIRIEQTYMNTDDGYEKRLRKRTQNGYSTYYLTVQKKNMGVSKVVTDKKMTEKDYLRFLSSGQIIGTVKKTRYSFINNKQYFKLDVFDDGLSVLEVDPTIENKEVILPDFISVIKDITSDEDYDNVNLIKGKRFCKHI